MCTFRGRARLGKTKEKRQGARGGVGVAVWKRQLQKHTGFEQERIENRKDGRGRKEEKRGIIVPTGGESQGTVPKVLKPARRRGAEVFLSIPLVDVRIHSNFKKLKGDILTRVR